MTTFKRSCITDRKIRFGLVGCGRISSRHVDAIASYADDAEITAVCDIDAEALERCADSTGARPFGSFSELLTAGVVDVIVLTTPSGLHASQGIEAAQNGLHVVTEKPMATRWRDATALVRVADEAGVQLFVVKQNRRNRTLQAVKKAITQGRFGRIYAVNLNVFWTRPQEYYDSASWRGTWEFDGGALMNQASHYIDLLTWLVGPVESVHAFTGTLARRIEVEDTGVANIKWRSGALGSLTVTMLTYPRNYEGSITIVGETGTVRVGGVAVNQLEHWEFADTLPEDEDTQALSYDTASVYGFGHTGYYGNVIQALRGNAIPETDGREGLQSLELLVAMYISARDGRRVSLPLEY